MEKDILEPTQKRKKILGNLIVYNFNNDITQYTAEEWRIWKI